MSLDTRSRNIAFSSALLFSVMFPTSCIATYILTDLGQVGSELGSYNSGPGINKFSLVVGASAISPSYLTAAIWTAGTPTFLDSLGGPYGFARGINDAGQIVGSSYTTGNVEHATLWNETTPRDLLGLGDSHSQAYEINNNGQIVGVSQSFGVTGYRATIWNNFVPSELKTLGGRSAQPLAINDNGHAVGDSEISGNTARHATLWKGDADALDLGTLGGTDSTSSFAYDINNGGRIVGVSETPDKADYRPTLWTDGGIQELETLGGSHGFARGINNLDHIVGSSAIAGNKSDRATLWMGAEVLDINTLLDESGIGWLLFNALAINDVGQIIGEGYFDGKEHGYLLTPCDKCVSVVTLPPGSIPEPTTLSLLTLGVLGLLILKNSSARRS